MLERKVYPSYFFFGALILYMVLFVIPSVAGLLLSFTDWSAFSHEINFVGFDNFARIFSPDENYFGFIWNTLSFTFITTVAKNILGVAFALLFTKKVFALNLHRSILFIPAVLSPLIIGMAFTSILHPRTGLLNTVLRGIGLPSLAQGWLINPSIALYSVMGVDTWRGMGYIMTICIAGIMSISPTYYEAADIDGANGVQKFFYITLPLLVPTLTVTTVLNVIYGLGVFDMIFVLTNGGPGFATEVLSTSVFREFSLGRYAIATTLSSVLLVFMLFIGFFLIKIMMKGEVEE